MLEENSINLRRLSILLEDMLISRGNIIIQMQINVKHFLLVLRASLIKFYS